MNDFELDDIKGLINTETLTGDPFIDARLQQYGQQARRIHPYYALFYRLAHFLKPDLTVELGSWQGTAAACFAAGWTEGVVITIDHHGDPGDEINKQRTVEAVQRYEGLIYLQGWTWEMLDVVEALEQPIDILFIDSWHQYEYARRDWNDYSPLLADGALVICDDIVKGDGPVIAGMQRFWDELPGEKFLSEAVHPGFPMGFLKWSH